MKRIFDTKAAPIHVQDFSEERISVVWQEDEVVHKAFHSHIQTEGMDQNLRERIYIYHIFIFIYIHIYIYIIIFFVVTTLLKIRMTALRNVRE